MLLLHRRLFYSITFKFEATLASLSGIAGCEYIHQKYGPVSRSELVVD